MEKIYSLILLAVAGVLIITAIKNFSQEYSKITAIVLGVILGGFVLAELLGVINIIKSIAQKTNINTAWLKSIFKICLISFLGQWGTQICRDAGENTIADKLETAVGITVVIICQPYFVQLISLALEIQ